MQVTIGANEQMIEFKLIDVLGFPDSTSFQGGYDVKGTVSIQAGKYSVKDAEVWFTTGHLYQLFEQLQKAYEKLTGTIIFSTVEDNIYFEMIFNKSGRVILEGYFQEYPSIATKLEFELFLDQSYIPKTLTELKKIIAVYGNRRGIS